MLTPTELPIDKDLRSIKGNYLQYELSFALTHIMTVLPEGFGVSLDTLQALNPGAESADLCFKLHLALVNLLAHAGKDGHHFPARMQRGISFTHRPHTLILQIM